MLVKKITICFCLLICFGLGIISEVFASAPNAKECISGKVDCDEQETKTPDETNKATSEDDGSIAFYLIKVAFALLLVLALIYLLIKFLNKRNKLFQQVTALENIGGISVGQNKSVQIIRIGEHIYVLGVGDNVELLHEITNEKEKEELLHKNQKGEFQPGTLITSLFQQKKDTEVKNQPKTDFKNMFASELNKIKNGRKKMIDQQKRKGDKHE